MGGRGFSSLAKTLCSGLANVAVRVVKQGTNRIQVLRRRLRVKNHGQNRGANVRVWISCVLEHLAQVGRGVRPKRS